MRGRRGKRERRRRRREARVRQEKRASGRSNSWGLAVAGAGWRETSVARSLEVALRPLRSSLPPGRVSARKAKQVTQMCAEKWLAEKVALGRSERCGKRRQYYVERGRVSEWIQEDSERKTSDKGGEVR